MDGMGCLVPVDHKDRGEILEQQALRVPLGHKDKGGWLEQQALSVLLAREVVGWSTQGGGKLAVQMSQELSWCKQEGLVEPITIMWEEQPTTSACLMIQTTSAMVLECTVTTTCMEWSMRLQANHSQLLTNTMFPVLCAMLQ